MFATSLQLDSISLPDWADTTVRNMRQAVVHSRIVIKAFNKTLAPVVIDSLKSIFFYLIQRERLWCQWTMHTTGITHNPLQAAFDAAHAELTSVESIETYRRIHYNLRETALDVIIVGLCGVVAISVGVELAQKGYRTAAKLYRTVYDRLNPNEPQPELLPSLGMALASTEIAEALASFAEVAEADVQAKANAIAVELERKPKAGTSKAAAKPKQTRARAGARGGK
jgi:hypothetical protein